MSQSAPSSPPISQADRLQRDATGAIRLGVPAAAAWAAFAGAALGDGPSGASLGWNGPEPAYLVLLWAALLSWEVALSVSLARCWVSLPGLGRRRGAGLRWLIGLLALRWIAGGVLSFELLGLSVIGGANPWGLTLLAPTDLVLDQPRDARALWWLLLIGLQATLGWALTREAMRVVWGFGPAQRWLPWPIQRLSLVILGATWLLSLLSGPRYTVLWGDPILPDLLRESLRAMCWYVLAPGLLLTGLLWLIPWFALAQGWLRAKPRPAEASWSTTGDQPDRPLSADTPCPICGYNLRGLHPGANCPECGANILAHAPGMPLRGAPAGWRLDTAWAAWGIAGAALGNLLVWGLLHGLNDQLWPWTRQTVSLRLSLNPGSGWFVNLWGVALALEAICGLLLTASLGLLVYGSDRARKAGLRVPGGRWAWLWVASAAAATALVLLGGQRNWRGDHLSFIGLLDWFALCLALIGAMLLLNGPLRWGRLAVGQQLGRLSRWVLIAAMVPATAPLLLMLASFTAEALSWWALVQRLDDYHVLAQGIDTGTTFAGWFLYATTALPSMLWSLGLLLVAILAHQARRELMECSDRSVPLRQLLGGLLSPAKPKPRSAPALPGPEPLPMPSQAQNPLPTQPSRPTFSLDMTPPENAARLRPPDPATALAQIDRRAAHRHDHRMIHQPPKQPLVCVSILSADFGIMARECQDVLSRGADMLHVDVMDGHFAPNLTMGPDMVRALRQHFPEVFLDVHLMVERPEMFIEPFAKAGASLCSFHAELCKPHKPDGLDAAELIRRIRGLGMSAGMVVNPPTAAEALEPWLDQIDLALVMSVHPGYSGQTFMPEALPKLRWLAQRVGPGTRLEVDGGVKPENVDQIVQAGADVLVTASALFGAQDRSAVIRRFHEAPMPT